MDIPIPFNFVGKIASWVWQRVTKVLLQKCYIDSHERWSSNHRLGSRWESLGEHLEYSLRLAQPTDPKPQIGKVALRSTGETLLNVDVFFEAYGVGVKYQEKISLCNIDQTPIVSNLTNIPLQQFLSSPGACINFSVEEIRFRQCIVKLASGEALKPFDSLRSFLTHNWILNDDWSYRWGYWWNCNAIKFAKNELSVYWRWCFGLPRVRVYSPLATASYRKPFTQSVLQGIGWIMGLSPLVTAQFWLAIWSGLFVMDEDDRLCFRWKSKLRGKTKE